MTLLHKWNNTFSWCICRWFWRANQRCSCLSCCRGSLWSATTSRMRQVLQLLVINREFTSVLTLPMIGLLSSTSQGCKYFWKPSKPFHVGVHKIALTEYSQMSTHEFQSLFCCFASFCICKISHLQHKGQVFEAFIRLFEVLVTHWIVWD